MPKLVLLLMLLLSIVLPTPRPGATHTAAAEQTPSGLRVLRSDTRGALIELTTPEPAPRGEGQYQRLELAGAGYTDEPGAPQMPQVAALLGAPPSAAVSVHVLEDEAVVAAGPYTIVPAPRPAPRQDDRQAAELHYEIDQQAYASTQHYPAAVATIGDEGWLRDQRIVRLLLAPYQYKPSDGSIRWHRRLLVEVRFNGGMPHSASGEASAGPLDDVLSATLLNYDSAKAWRSRPAATPRDARQPVQITPRLKISVDRDGLYQLTYADLQAAGFIPLDPRALRMTSRGADVAIDVRGEDDGSFDPGDTIVFYGEQFRGTLMQEKYTNENVYWLAANAGERGPRMATVDGTPTGLEQVPQSFIDTVRSEESHVWWTWHFADGNYLTPQETWFWERVIAGATVTRSYPITLTDVAALPVDASARGSMVARNFNASTAPDHHTRVGINGSLLEERYWDGRSRYTFDVRVPQSQLRDGRNQFDVTIIPDAGVANESMYIDWFEISYNRAFVARDNRLSFNAPAAGTWRYQIDGFTSPQVYVFDITSPLSPSIVANGEISGAGPFAAAFHAAHGDTARFALAAEGGFLKPRSVERYQGPDLHAAANGADYLVITHPAFLSAAQNLASYRASQGMRAMVVDINDLYNQFNDGIYGPDAIKNFLAYAYSTWQAPAPSYALLVGDGHWNFKGYSVPGWPVPPIYLPPNLVWADPWQGEVDSSNNLATIVGDDLLPDIVVGRMPVNSNTEAQAIVDKTIAYEQGGPQPWMRTMIFAADNADSAGDFPAISEAMIAGHTPADFDAVKLYIGSHCSGAGCAEMLRHTLNISGGLFLSYTGHASINYWASEQLLKSTDAAGLENGNRLPIVLSMDCLDGFWSHPLPGQESIAETLLRASGKGAVASFSPTGLGLATSHDILHRGLFQSLFVDHERRLGPATVAAKLQLHQLGNSPDLIQTFTLFGDPALRVPISALSLTPEQSALAGEHGSTVAHELQITNTGLTTDTFVLELSGNSWDVTAPAEVTLAAGASTTISVTVAVPGDLTVAGDTVTLTARAKGDRLVRRSSTLTTTAIAHAVFIPAVRR